jgi:hypothetical protein
MQPHPNGATRHLLVRALPPEEISARMAIPKETGHPESRVISGAVADQLTFTPRRQPQ